MQSDSPTLRQSVALAIVVSCGFACLALEVAGPRIIGNVFGSTYIVWAAGIVTTLGGLAIGYWLGSTQWHSRRLAALRVALCTSAVFCACERLICSLVTEWMASSGTGPVLITMSACMLVPAICFGLVSPLILGELLRTPGRDPVRTAGSVFALGTVGNIAGGLWIVFSGFDSLGVAGCLYAMSGVLLVCSMLTGGRLMTSVATAGVIACATGQAGSADQDMVVWSGDTKYQMVTVLQSADQCRVALVSGPGCQSFYDKCAGQSCVAYARVAVGLVSALESRSIAIIGGAGNAIALQLESLGVRVDVVEVDPWMVDLSQRFFGSIRGRTVIADGRAAVRWDQLSGYDCMLIDAFTAPGIVPSHLLTVEALAAFKGATVPGSPLLLSIHGAPAGAAACAVDVVASTARAVFKNVRVWPTSEYRSDSTEFQNMIIICTDDPACSLGLACNETVARIATDDRNPLDVLFLKARSVGLQAIPPGRVHDWVREKL